jgi:hypothetical protein
MFKNFNPVKIIVGLSVVALGVVGYYIYTILDSFTPTTDTASIPIEIEVDDTITAGEEVADDTTPPKSDIWSQTLTDYGNGSLQDASGNLFYIDADGNIIDDQGTIFDDATGQILNT